MYDELSFADDHLLCIPANLIIPACINAPFLLILSEKERVHNLFTHAFVVGFQSEKYTWHKSQEGNKIGKDEYRRRCQDG